MSSRKSPVQSGLAFSERVCRVRVCQSEDPGGRQLFKVQQQRPGQLRGALLGVPGAVGAGGFKQIQTETVRKPARRLFWQAFLNSSVPAGTDSISRHAESDPRCVTDSQRSLLAAFWLRPQQNFPYHVGSSEPLGDGYPHSAPQGSSAPHASGPTGANSKRKGYSSGGTATAARLGRPPNGPVVQAPEVVAFSAGCQLSPTQPVTRRSKGSTNCFWPVSASKIAAKRLKWYCFVS